MANNNDNGIMAISTFKAAFDGGTRPNRFKVTIPGVENHVLVKAASIPAETIGMMQIPFRGRVAKLPGDRAYAEWTFSIIDDTTENVRQVLVEWHRIFNDHRSNIVPKDILGGSSEEYKSITVMQLDMQGEEHTGVTLHQCWPIEIGAIDLSYDTADSLTEFPCTIAYDWLESATEGGSGQGGGPMMT